MTSVPLTFVTGAFQDKDAEPVVAVVDVPPEPELPEPVEGGVVEVLVLPELEVGVVVALDFDVLAAVEALGGVEVEALDLAEEVEVVEALEVEAAAEVAAVLPTEETSSPQAARANVQLASTASRGARKFIVRVRMAQY